MTEKVTKEKKIKKKKSFKWLIILGILILLNVIAVHFYKPIAPEISIKSESLIFDDVDGVITEKPWFTIPKIGPVYLTNTLTSNLITFLFVVLLAVAVQKSIKQDPLEPHGIVLLLDFVMDTLEKMVETSIPEKWRKTVYKYYLGIFIFVLIANLTKLIPIFETIGFAVPVAKEGFAAQKWAGWIYGITANPVDSGGYKMISFLRGGPTDLNFTIAVAFCAVIFIQIVGVKAKGIGYFNRFFNFKSLFTNKKTGVIEFMVGLLELISELAKIASFGFRLFGNMFAGMVLVTFLGYMMPYAVDSVMMLYEVWVGLLQAFVFGILTAVFMGMAIGGESEKEKKPEIPSGNNQIPEGHEEPHYEVPQGAE